MGNDRKEMEKEPLNIIKGLNMVTKEIDGLENVAKMLEARLEPLMTQPRPDESEKHPKMQRPGMPTEASLVAARLGALPARVNTALRVIE